MRASCFLLAALFLILPPLCLGESDFIGPLEEISVATSTNQKLVRARELAEESLKNGGHNRIDENESMDRSSPSLMKGFQGLVLTLGVFFILIFVLKKLKGRIIDTGERKIKVIERTALTSKTSLLRVEINGQESLISVGSEQVAVIPPLTSTSIATKSPQLQSTLPFERELEQSCVNEKIAKAS